MFDEPFSMVVAIVLIVTIGRIIRSKHKAQHGIIEDNGGNQQRILQTPETDQMRDEIKSLKERIQVLERIATDNNSANDLNRQIEELRNR
jgi:L-asparaginase II